MSEALQHLTDETGKNTAVVLPIAEYEKLLEEPTIPHEKFKAELKRDGIV